MIPHFNTSRHLVAALVLLLACLAGPLTAQSNTPALTPTATHVVVKGSSVVNFTAEFVPEGATVLEWDVTFDAALSGMAGIRPGSAAPLNSRFEITPVEGSPNTFRARVELPSPASATRRLAIASVTYSIDSAFPTRGHVAVAAASIQMEDGTSISATGDTAPLSVVLVNDVITLFALMAGVVGFVYWLSTLKFTEGFFRYFPPLIWMYFVPMTMTTIGITPDYSPLYSPFMSRVILPAVLVLLLISSDLRGLSRLGGKAFLMMLFATSGIVVGAIVSFGLFSTLFGESMPADTWKGVAALSGSWIGGSANMFAVLESIGTPPGIIGPMVIVDTVLAYSWLGLLIALSVYQDRVDKYHKADRTAIDEMASRLQAEQETQGRAPAISDVAMMIGLAFVVSQFCLWLGIPVFSFVKDTLGLGVISEVVNAYGWAILLITAAGLLLSMTPVRQLEFRGASSIGYVGLYLLLTCYGAQANFRAILEVPVFFGIGALWIAIHITFLYIGFRVLRAPMVLAAASSMANIGGTASAPVVTAAYNQSLAPLGLLLAILGGTLGTPLALFVVATTCRALAGG